jgi:phosphate transport system substrate-binding protein
VTITNPGRLGALALVATLAIGACSGAGASSEPTTGADGSAPAVDTPTDLSGTITIDGSSTVYPITEAVA